MNLRHRDKRYPALIRTRLPDLVASARVAGEITDWSTPLAMTPCALCAEEVGGDRVFELSASLPAGVYAYKLRLSAPGSNDDAWALDPSNPRTRAALGYRNNVLSVGGAPEPVLFAPGPPFVAPEEGGGLIVRAALRRGSGDRLSVLWEEVGAGPPRSRPLAPVAEEDEHLVFQARLPVSTGALRVRFELPDGSIVGREDAPGEPFVIIIRELAAASDAPAWLRDAVVYMILVDRFRGEGADAAWGADPGPERPAGGHLDGVRRSLGDLVELGVNTLYLTPVHVAASCHRYDMVDPLAVDPALGGEEAFVNLIEEARARGVRVLVDLALTHAGEGFPPYEDVRKLGRASRFASWFQWSRDPSPELIHYGSRTDAPRLNLHCPEVQDLALEVAARWAARGVSGIRLDAAAEVPMDLTKAIHDKIRELRPDAAVIGEIIPAHAWRWLAEGAVSAATDFEWHRAVVDFIAHRSIEAPLMRDRLLRMEASRGGPASSSLRFLSTHDHPRFATLARHAGGASRARLGMLFLMSSPGIPALLYGEEVGMTSEVVDFELDSVWPDRAPMPWAKGARDEAMRSLTRRLIEVRRRSPALSRGDFTILHADEGLLVFRRSAEGEIIDVAVNASDASIEVDIEDTERPEVDLVAAVGEAKAAGQTIELGRDGGVILRRRRDAEGERRRRLAVLHNEKLRDAELRAGSLTARSWPSRIDLSITEVCNLQCRHCITLAPERTRARTARTLEPWLLDRLRDPLAFASYVGFVHGGEPLAAPNLFDVLGAVGEARRGAPTMIHLLTNGLLLSERMSARLFEAGVRSVAVSLDGASAETNDAIRSGGRFGQVVENLRSASRLRRSLGADVRIGISFVILRQNAGEAATMVDLCADLGIEWLKLEEAVPATPFAERSLLRADDAGLREAVLAAVERGRALGIRVMDHTAMPRVWRCKLAEDPRAAELLRADEFVNRSEIHPCRAPWEHACIEPNGDVRMATFFNPVIGNLAEEPLSSVWNGPGAVSDRARSRASRLCGDGPATCVDPS
ncbi:MAG TPA: alpha-amylase family glycosyl hydrolase [Polyangiaceae bacterium]|nr:alpha-amylase family glycosyl hydrolase [Polyangiaceae bacterium]